MSFALSSRSDTAYPDQAARRQHLRQRIICSGYLEVDGSRPILCMVRDLSEGGARLRVPAGFAVRGAVALKVPDLGWSRPAEIVWDQGHSVGVKFVGPAKSM